MWKKAVAASVSLVALHGVAQAPTQWKTVNQVLDEVAQNALGSSPLLHQLSVVFDEAFSDLSQNKVGAHVVLDMNGLQVKGGRVGADVTVRLQAASSPQNGQRAVTGVVSAKIDGDVMANLKQAAKDQLPSCDGLASRAESYDKLRQGIYCKSLVKVEQAQSLGQVASVLKGLQSDLLAQLPSYIQTAKGADVAQAQRELKIVKAVKIEGTEQQFVLSIQGDLDIAENSQSKTSLRVIVTEREIGAWLGFDARIDENRFQREKGELVKWVGKIENRDFDLVNAAQAKLLEVLKGIEQASK